MRIISNPTLGTQPVKLFDIQTNFAKKSSGGSGDSGGGDSGGGAVACAAPAPAVDHAQVLKDNFGKMLNTFWPEDVTYDALSESEIKEQVAAWLRPGYDQAILNRQEQTKSYAAELDVDALSRGMGSSTYVTDAKSRLLKNEARDIASLEGDYGASLAQAVYERLDSEKDRELEVTLYNKDMEQNAYELAYSAALALMGLSTGGGGGGGGGGRRSGSSRSSYGRSSSSSGVTSAENCATFLSSLSKAERAEVYGGTSAQAEAYRSEIVASVGISGFYELQQQYSTIP